MTLQQLKTKLLTLTGTDIKKVFFDWAEIANEQGQGKIYPCILWSLNGATFKKDLRVTPKQPAKILTLSVFIIQDYDVKTEDKITVWDAMEEDLDAYLLKLDAMRGLSVERMDEIEGEYFPEGLISVDSELGVGYKIKIKMYCSGITLSSGPVATAGTLRTLSGFTANWNVLTGATGYLIDVATDAAFSSILPAWNNKDASNVSSIAVIGLNPNTIYYYRVRGYNGVTESLSSNVITLQTTQCLFDDWFLPSRDELYAMYVELYLQGVGGFDMLRNYWSSSEASLESSSWNFNMETGSWSDKPKSSITYIHACRAFTAVAGAYDLRDIGPAGGWIFWKSGNDYLEAAPSDIVGSHTWSNIDNVAIGTTGTAIGTGQANTTAIISQIGHTNSAAKLCDDLII